MVPTSKVTASGTTQGSGGPSNVCNVRTQSQVPPQIPSATQLGGNTSTITPAPVFPTEPVEPQSPVATSDGIIIGRLLADLSKSAKGYSNDITIPATKTKFLDDIDDTEHKLETMFKDMGGKTPPDTGGCSGGARKHKRGLGDLVGDIFNTVRCAINSLNSLKGHIDVPDPDIRTIGADLDDIGTLADEIGDKDDDDDDDASTGVQGPTKDTSSKEHSTQEPSTTHPFSTGASATTTSTTMVSSTRASSSDPCAEGLVTGSAGALVKRANTADSCNYECPSPVPAAPTSGGLAITPGPTDTADAQKKHRRQLAGRINLVKMAKGPISSINNCKLLTPSSPPDPVTTPDYPGGYGFWQSDSNGQLPQSFQAISRYYRTSEVLSKCAPTVTSVPANQLTPDQNDENEIVSVDHAYENGWLQGFFEYIIESPNPESNKDQLSCAAANAIFFNVYDGAPGCSVNRMAPIHNALASNINPDFVVMSQWLNGDAKGWVSHWNSFAPIAQDRWYCLPYPSISAVCGT